MKKAPLKGYGLLYLYTSWCTYCVTTGPAVDELAKERQDITVIKIDAEEDIETTLEVNVKTFPTIVLTHDGKEIARRGSALIDELREWVEKSIS